MDLRARSHFHSGTSTHRKSLLAHPWAQRSLPDRSLQYKQPMWQHQVQCQAHSGFVFSVLIRMVEASGPVYCSRKGQSGMQFQSNNTGCLFASTSFPSSRRTPTRSGRSTCGTPTESVLAATREPREPQWLHNGYCRYATS